MAEKRTKHIAGKWQMILDRYMSGSFLPLFGWTLFLSTLAFIGIWCVLSWLGVDWSLGDAFIQLSNPSSSGMGVFEVSYSEWFAIIITNLFGLFVINGIILTLLVNWVSNRKERHEKGEARYSHVFDSNFSVIIGGHKVVSSLVRDLLARKKDDYILIQTQRDPAAVRREIRAEVKNDKDLRNVVIYSGDRTSWHELEELKLGKAREIYIIGEPDFIDKSSHDSISMQTWDLMKNHITDLRQRKKIPCHIMFEYQSTFSAFQFTDLNLEDSKVFRFIPFSIYENWAQKVLIPKRGETQPFYLPLDGISGISYSSHQRVHLIVIGMSKMGIALAVEAAHIAHYPNFNNPNTRRPRTLITFIDRDARKEMLYFMGRFKQLFQMVRWRFVKAPEDLIQRDKDEWKIYDTIQETNEGTNQKYPWNDPMTDENLGSPYCGGYLGENLIDIDFEFIEGDSALPSIQKYISDACADDSEKTTIAVCFPNASESMSAALYLDSSVYENVQQIWVQQPESGALAEAVSNGITGRDTAKFRAIRPFGMLEQSDYLERINSIEPKLVAYAYHCKSAKDKTSLEEEYKNSKSVHEFLKQVEDHWLTIGPKDGKSAISKKWSNIYCANSIDTKIRSFGVNLSTAESIMDNNMVNDLAKVEHNRWVIEQLFLGERPVGKEYAGRLPLDPETDSDERSALKSRNIHPDIISNEMLKAVGEYDKEISRVIPVIYNVSLQS